MKTKFKSAAAAAAFLADDPEVEKQVVEEVAKTRLVTILIKARMEKKWSQKQMAEALHCDPSRICRIESGSDDKLRWSEVISWFQALGLNVSLLLDDKTMPRAARIKHCVLRTHQMLEELISIAKETSGEPEIAKQIRQFYGEVLFNFITRFSDNYESLLSVIQVSDVSLPEKEGNEQEISANKKDETSVFSH
ncbi:TPA: transcriptional regulator [Candidatus Sumerlaeota bacterium]|nr:transcriptional regulator [Candidatus Sumerlaeota bacterium]